MSGLLDVVNKTWHRIEVAAGICASDKDLADFESYLDNAEKYTKYAVYGQKLISDNREVAERLAKASDAISNVKGPISNFINTCRDVKAASDLIVVLKVLNKWVEPNTQVSNAEAAAAFDKLFGVLGQLVKKLPYPAKAYAGVFEQCSISQFFANMQRGMYPTDEKGNFQNNAHGRALKAAYDSIDQ